jgi:hypothetical protein
MVALGLSEKDFVVSLFALVRADRYSPLLSIWQWYMHILYRGLSAHVTIVYCPEI